MNYLIIDDNENFAISLFEKLICDENGINKYILIEKEEELHLIANRIQEKITNNTILVININIRNNKVKRQFFGGIELLKWLRLKAIYNHCIAFSFLTPSKIIKANPLNSILYSKGVTFIQAPFFASELKLDNKETADRENLLPFFRAEIDLVKIRHELANYYGLTKLLEVHKIVNPSFKEISSFETYKYKLLEYVYYSSNKNNPIKQTQITQIRDRIEEIKGSSPNVIYLDDKASLGWSNLLIDLLGYSFKTIDIEEADDEETLFQKFEILQNNTRVDLFICDLKLKIAEASLTDYTELTSYKLIKKIRTSNAKQKILYFTATNDLNKYKRILKLPKYNPQIIFTKEGVDQLYSPTQSINNYTELIDSLFLLLQSENAIRKVHSLQLLNNLQSVELLKVSNEIDMVFKNLTITQSIFDDFDFVIFDTNAFYDLNSSINIFKHIYNYPNKTILHKSVYAEIKWFAIDNGRKETSPVASLLANFFLKYFNETDFSISEELMTNEEITSANKLQLGKDFADKFLVKLSQVKSEKFNILFVSSDRAEGKRKGKNESDGPISILTRRIKETNNKNLKLSNPQMFLKGKILNIKEKDYKNMSYTTSEKINSEKPKIESQNNQSNISITQNGLEKIFWKECTWENNTFSYNRNGKVEEIIIGKKNINRFKKILFETSKPSNGVAKIVFNILKETEIEKFEVVTNGDKSKTIYNINAILDAIEKIS